YRDAREAYQKTVDRDPSNTIARKNLARLATLKVEEAAPASEQVDPRMFIAETGKTGHGSVVRPAARDVLAKLAAGDQVVLRPDGRTLNVETTRGIHVGEVDPKIALRLIELMRSGNQYAAAVMSNDDNNVRIFIRETLQSAA